MRSWLRSTAVLLLAPLLAACGDDDGISPPPGLTAEQVSGIYRICTLSFVPIGLRTADVLAAATEMDPEPPLDFPNLRLDRAPQGVLLEYVPKGGLIERRLTGSYTLGTERVTVDFSNDAATTARNDLLLPDPLQLQFQSNPKGLVVATAQGRYSVPRSAYARLAGYSEEEARNFADPIEGILNMRLTAGQCS